MASPAQPAGWYPDPHGLPALRWWDGREWTAHIQPGATATPPAVPAAAPSGPPLPGAHTRTPAASPIVADIRSGAASADAAPGGGGQRPGPAGGYAVQPVDAVSAQLGHTTPATPPPPRPAAGPAAAAPRSRAVVAGAVSLLINPLLLCSIVAIVLGVRGLPGARRAGTLAIALGVAGALTHIALIVAVVRLR